MKALAELIPQVFFDILARYVPGLVLFGSWIFLFGQDEWTGLLSTVVGGKLDSGNALPAATLALLFVPFVVGYVIAPLAKAVQRGNERGWLLPPRPSRSVYESGRRMWRPKYWWVLSDKGAGDGYDWLRKNASEAGAFSAKIRAEFTMNNALAVAFLAITVMACFAGERWWALASGLATPLMAYRGATTEETFQKTTRKLCKAASQTPAGMPARAINLDPPRRLIWLIPEDNVAFRLWEDGKGWLDIRTHKQKQESSEELENADAVEPILAEVAAWPRRRSGVVPARSDRKERRRDGKELARKLQHEAGSGFVFRPLPSFWRTKP